MSSKLSHADWVEAKEREQEDAAYQRTVEKRKAALQEDARKAKAREQFDAWLVDKETKERALELLAQLGPDRRSDKEQWFEVCVTLSAVDRLRALLLPAEDDEGRGGAGGGKPLLDDFYKWSKDAEGARGHEFENVPVDGELARTFSRNAQEIMSEYAEQMDRKGDFVIPSLKYQVEKVKQAAHDKRNLYNPDKAIYNRIFNRLLRSEADRARAELDKRVQSLTSKRVEGGAGVDAAERRALQELGLQRLAKWVEEDRVAAEERAAARKKEDKAYAKKVHEGFVAKKDSFMIRLPGGGGSEARGEEPDDAEEAERLRLRSKVLFGNATNLSESSAAKMSFARGKPHSVRPVRAKAASNTVDLLFASGGGGGGGDESVPQPAFAYATNRRDLEAARARLAQDGHVFKENFKDVDGDHLHDEFRAAGERKGKKERVRELVQAREEKAEESYRSWSLLKEQRARALEALSHVDRPGKTGQGAALDEQHWRFVGEQLKAVDPTLFGAWSEWSEGFRAPGQCKATWDSLPPNVCDTCTPSSAVHKVLLKLLNRPGVNFADIFDMAVDRQLRRNLASDGRDAADASPAEREQVAASLQLNSRQFSQMMLDAGIKLQPAEVRILTSLFDEDGDGLISRKEFLDLTGTDPRPGARGEALALLRGGDFCCWEQACHVTGLATAYEVVPKGRPEGDEAGGAEDEAGGAYGSDPDHQHERQPGLAPESRSLPLRMRSGKVKRGWERLPLPDLAKRMQRLLQAGDRTAADFLEPPPKSCELSRWTPRERQAALDSLEQLATRNRELSATLAVKSAGEPPLAPVLELAAAGETSLQLRWKPAEGSMFPSFFVLETAGREGSKDHRSHTFREVLRDPPNATEGAKQRGSVLMQQREPGTKYFFRLRAINGYGASPYTHCCFSTAPAQPPVPVVKELTTTTVRLHWGGAESAAKKLQRELRDIFFQLANEDKAVDRERLLDTLDRHFPALVKQLDSLPSAQIPGTTVLGMLEAFGGKGDAIQWKELQAWLAAAAEKDTKDKEAAAGAGAGAGGASPAAPPKKTPFVYTVCRCVSDEEVNFAKEGALGGGRGPVDVAYAVLRASDWNLSRSLDNGAADLADLPTVHLLELPEPSSVAREKPALRVLLPKAKQTPAKTVVGELVEPVTHLEVFEQAYSGADTSCLLSGLEPGKSYQFRLLAQHPGEEGPTSRMGPALVVHMPETANDAPTVGKGGVTTDSVHLVWGDSASQASAGAPAADAPPRAAIEKPDVGKDWEKLVRDWVKDPDSEVSGGVSDATLRKTFMRYDRDASGALDSKELVELFSDLGLPTRGPVFEDALKRLDANGDGQVSYPEFAKWWRDDAASRKFVLLHRQGEEEKWTVVYRGTNTYARITGLTPNTKHCFATQVESNKGLSARSRALEITTAPETPQQPAVVEAGPKHLRVKWYAGLNGAQKYQLELLAVDSLVASPKSGAGSAAAARRAASGGWRKVYEGSGTLAYVDGLQPDTVYRLHVRALNRDGLASSDSLPAQISTAPASTSLDRLCAKTNAANYFNIECTGDLVAGDTVLFTERVFSKDAAAGSSPAAASGKSPAAAGRRGAPGSKTPTSAPGQRRSMGLSQQSVQTLGKGELASEFVTERTIAARCVNTWPSEKNSAATQLSLEVIWSTVSKKETPATYLLTSGQRISRLDTDVYRFETFRAHWAHEQCRWTRAEEQDHERAQP